VNNYEKWLELKSEIRKLTEQLHEVESDIYIEARDGNNLNLNGSKTFNDGEYKITIKHTESYKVDQEKAAAFPGLFKMKYEFDKTMYKTLNGTAKEAVDEAITITPGKPGFTVERL
jgi:hypothetical protein